MSGIDEMKVKIKKKMTLDDLPVPSQKKNSQESIAVHSAVNTAAHLDEQQLNTAKQLPVSIDVHQDVQQDVQYSVNTAVQYAETAKQNSVNTEKQQNADLYSNRPTHNTTNYSNTVIQQAKTTYGRKVTLYLTEELYKAFNDIYAQRMLEGRKTEKSALICEAIELLWQNENKR
jgi:hypothetical protein